MADAAKNALTFDSDPMEKDTEILGFPRLRLRAQSTAPLAHWVARLEDVRPDGTVALVTGAALNGAQRASRTRPKALPENELQDFSLDLHFTTWVFPKGHRIRLSLSNAAFPMLWPTPYPMQSQVQVHHAGSALTLPVIPPARRPTPQLLPIEPRREREGTSSSGEGWPYDPVISREGSVVKAEGMGEESYSFNSWKVRKTTSTEYWVNEDEPSNAGFIGSMEHEFESGENGFTLSSRMEIVSDEKEFLLKFGRKLTRGQAVVREKTWEKKIPRDFQ